MLRQISRMKFRILLYAFRQKIKFNKIFIFADVVNFIIFPVQVFAVFHMKICISVTRIKEKNLRNGLDVFCIQNVFIELLIEDVLSSNSVSMIQESCVHRPEKFVILNFIKNSHLCFKKRTQCHPMIFIIHFQYK